MKAFDVQDAIKKMADVDKDFRITAITDLTEELRKESFTMDAAVETKVVESILRLLEDSAKEVQDVAVKSLGPLVRKVKEEHVTSAIGKLSEHLANDKRGAAELREVSNSGLKAVLRGVDASLGEKVSAQLAPGLIAAIKKGNLDIVQECLDVVNDLLTRFGTSTTPANIQAFEEITLPLLDAKRNLIKQRAIWVLTNVSRNCPETGFKKLSEELIKKMQTDIKKQGTAIQLVGAMARNVAFRMGAFVGAFVPLLATAISKSSSDGDEEIKENAFQTFASFVESCPRASYPHIDTILDLCVKFVSWDPNQLEDEGEEGGSGDEGSDDGSGDEASEDEDDKTWMVRRAAAKTISSIVIGHPDKLETVVAKAATTLVKQFKERESTARHEILAAYETLVLAASGHPSAAFAQTLPSAVTALAQLLSHKSADTRVAAVTVLRSIAKQAPGALDAQLKVLIPGISACLPDKVAPLRIASLDLVTQILHGSSVAVQPHLDTLFKAVEKVLKTPGVSGRVAASALGACEAFLVAGAGKFDFMTNVYKSFEPLFKQQDLDSETKEAAIRAAARAVCNVQTKLPNATATLDVLVERLGTELTRECATIAVGTIAESAAKVGDAWLGKAVPLIGGFCGAAPRSLKIAALNTLALVMENYGDVIKTHDQVLNDTAALIDAEDVMLAQLAVLVATKTVHANPKAVANIKKNVYPRILTLIPSPLLEGNSLAAVAELFAELVKLDTKGVSFADLAKDLDGLLDAAQPDQIHLFRNVGAAYAQVITQGDQKLANATVEALVKKVAGKTPAQQLSAIYILADVGRIRDVSDYKGVVEALATALDSELRPVALAASYALGSVAIGNLTKYLPFIIGDMKKNPKRQLLLLQAIKEIVSGHQSSMSTSLRVSLSASMAGSAASDIAVHLDTLLPILFEHSASEDDLTRNAVSECLGRLAKIASDRILPELEKRSTDKSPFARSTVIHALRCAVSERPLPDLDQRLGPALKAVAAAVTDPDIRVRLAGLQAIGWALRTKPRLIKPHLAAALKGIFAETVIDQSLIKVIDLGQMKHITDDGFDKRTSAYDLLYVLLDTAFEAITVEDYTAPILAGIGDVLSIREQSYKILRRLAQVAGAQCLASLDKLLAPLEKEIKATIPKAEPLERNLVMKKAAFSAAMALAAIPGAPTKLQDLVSLKVFNPKDKEWNEQKQQIYSAYQEELGKK